nr:hypothetical protein [Tanacetum cinerariifolium]
MANHQHLAEIILAMMVNKNNNNQQTQKRKCADKLRNFSWKWSEVIIVDDLLDEIKPGNVPNTEETTTEP